ncbi:MAG: methyltransferase domain-containing protein [Planctomycetota bacterium]
MTDAQDWFDGFFEGLALELWRLAVDPAHTAREVDDLEARLGLAPGARILDAPCGLGRHSLEFARRGHRVLGIDLSAKAIEGAIAAAADAGLAVEFRRDDMRHLPRDASFDAALCGGNSFGYLDRRGTADQLAALAASLRPGGRVAIDCGLVAEAILPRFVEHEEVEIGGILFVEDNRYDLRGGFIETTYTFRRGDEVEVKRGRHHVYTLAEIEAMFERAGFRVETATAGYGEAPFTLASPLLVLSARKI